MSKFNRSFSIASKMPVGAGMPHRALAQRVASRQPK